MNAIIEDAVKKEVTRQIENRNTSLSAPVSAATATTSTNPRTVSRLSGLLKRMRNGVVGKETRSKKAKDKEHRVQVRWLHYSCDTKEFEPVVQKNGGGKRFVSYNELEALSLEELKSRASALFFPGGTNKFAGSLKNMRIQVCDCTRSVIFEFPNNGTIIEYLNANGLYPSTTFFYLRTQDEEMAMAEFESSDDDINEVVKLDDKVRQVDEPHEVSKQTARRIICNVCHCTYLEGASCLRCEQDKEYNDSLLSDKSECFENENIPDRIPDIAEVRAARIASFSTNAVSLYSTFC